MGEGACRSISFISASSIASCRTTKALNCRTDQPPTWSHCVELRRFDAESSMLRRKTRLEDGATDPPNNQREEGMIRKSGLAAAGLGAGFCVAPVAAPAAAETPKRGGILTYMTPADAPPSFDGHRETTFATVHAAAPFYSVLIRVNPNNPSSTTDFVCDLCAEMPTPTDDGKTYT